MKETRRLLEPTSPEPGLYSGAVTRGTEQDCNSLIKLERTGGADGTRTRDPRRDRPDFTSSSMSEDEWALSISPDYPLPFAFARARFWPDTRKILENSAIGAAIRPAHIHAVGDSGTGLWSRRPHLRHPCHRPEEGPVGAS